MSRFFVLDLNRNVRDRLVKSERLSLAMEVSTKCGLDTTAVWSAWGSSCLRAGAYEMARSKFSRVLKVMLLRLLYHISCISKYVC